VTPEQSSYISSTSAAKITYETDCTHTKGPINQIEVVNGGKAYYALPGVTTVTSANGTDFSTRALMDSRIEGGTGSQASGYFTVINEGASHLQIQTYTGITSSNDSAVTMAANSTITISGNYQAA